MEVVVLGLGGSVGGGGGLPQHVSLKPLCSSPARRPEEEKEKEEVEEEEECVSASAG